MSGVSKKVQSGNISVQSRLNPGDSRLQVLADGGDDSADRDADSRETKARDEGSNGRSQLDEKGRAVVADNGEETLDAGSDVADQLADLAGAGDDGAERDTDAGETETRDEGGDLRAELDEQHLQVLAEDGEEVLDGTGGVGQELASGTVAGNRRGNSRGSRNRRGNRDSRRSGSLAHRAQDGDVAQEALQARKDLRKLRQRKLVHRKAIQRWDSLREGQVRWDRETPRERGEETREATDDWEAGWEHWCTRRTRETRWHTRWHTGWDAGRDIRDRSRQVGRALRNRAGDDSAGQSGSDGEDGGLHFG